MSHEALNGDNIRLIEEIRKSAFVLGYFKTVEVFISEIEEYILFIGAFLSTQGHHTMNRGNNKIETLKPEHETQTI